MKRNLSYLLVMFLIACGALHAQGTAFKTETRKSPDGKYTYTVVEGDPIGVRTYILNNGLTVMLSVNKTTPRIQTLIATRAGSKNDPADHTGLAHYLEHMLFKGTDKFGTKDWAKEKPLLDRIEQLYEDYGRETDATRRKAIYHIIDSVSGEAAKYAIANEYDKMVGSIGAKGTNAFTSVEQTVYENDIPENQLEKWLMVESERFRAPVFRIFHTELEAVYEEKNIGLDNDDRKVFESGLAALFQKHPYGTQTTIGTVEHLKRPSLRAIRNYYNTYYVPNNMGIILAGDLDPDKTVEMIDKYFGRMDPKALPAFVFKPEEPKSKPQVVTVNGPDAANLRIGFRLPGAGTREARLLEVTDLLLAYKTAGLIDLNLKKKQLVQDASSSPQIMTDYSVHWLTGVPKDGQTLEQVRDLLLAQIDRLKRGEFDEAQLKAVMRNLRVDQIKQYEGNDGRAYAMMDAYTSGDRWPNFTHKIDQFTTFTKKDIVDFVKKNYGNDYVIVYKRTGEDKSIVKVEKPPITPIALNSDDRSPFVKSIIEKPAPPIAPTFIDYKKDIVPLTLKNGAQVYYLPNQENDLFSMYYVFDMGKRNDQKLPYAIKYLQYLGTSKYSAEQLSKEFFKLGCEFGVSASDDQVYVSLTGLKESFEPAFKLFEEMLATVKPDQQALDAMVASELKDRADAKLDKETILWKGLWNYAIYGKNNPFTDRLSESELKSLKGDDLVNYIKNLTSYQHKVLYYGPTPADQLVSELNTYHRMPEILKAYPPATQYVRNDMKDNVVYFTDYDMVQAEVIWLNKSSMFDPTSVPVASLFNEYYGGGMGSVVFQNIRESKALAYSTFASYIIPAKNSDPFYVMSYVGTQADKLSEAIPAMNGLLSDMPRRDGSFALAKDGLRNKIETERVTKANILFDYLSAQKRGMDHDMRRDIYASLDKLNMDDLQQFHDARYKDRAYAYCVLGSKSKVNMDVLRKYGKVVDLSLTDIFGY
ncbi:MAG: peptidase [Chlorobi bacterium]|nr:peptidase [Chlorobiota bacterium]